eukprot:TRINITY_DN5705_c0_g1_i1.p1 TRINITY_DN5705_c0_g1~~TRINITY_DN5705_c0_g1_i1.p1  ORF type:complete len:829 (-),score=233.49 TRINITY_DN5705_c0_g1_i1:71-2557(-)
MDFLKPPDGEMSHRRSSHRLSLQQNSKKTLTRHEIRTKIESFLKQNNAHYAHLFFNNLGYDSPCPSDKCVGVVMHNLLEMGVFYLFDRLDTDEIRMVCYEKSGSSIGSFNRDDLLFHVVDLINENGVDWFFEGFSYSTRKGLLSIWQLGPDLYALEEYVKEECLICGFDHLLVGCSEEQLLDIYGRRFGGFESINEAILRKILFEDSAPEDSGVGVFDTIFDNLELSQNKKPVANPAFKNLPAPDKPFSMSSNLGPISKRPTFIDMGRSNEITNSNSGFSEYSTTSNMNGHSNSESQSTDSTFAKPEPLFPTSDDGFKVPLFNDSKKTHMKSAKKKKISLALPIPPSPKMKLSVSDITSAKEKLTKKYDLDLSSEDDEPPMKKRRSTNSEALPSKKKMLALPIAPSPKPSSARKRSFTQMSNEGLNDSLYPLRNESQFETPSKIDGDNSRDQISRSEEKLRLLKKQIEEEQEQLQREREAKAEAERLKQIEKEQAAERDRIRRLEEERLREEERIKAEAERLKKIEEEAAERERLKRLEEERLREEERKLREKMEREKIKLLEEEQNRLKLEKERREKEEEDRIRRLAMERIRKEKELEKEREKLRKAREEEEARKLREIERERQETEDQRKKLERQNQEKQRAISITSLLEESSDDEIMREIERRKEMKQQEAKNKKEAESERIEKSRQEERNRRQRENRQNSSRSGYSSRSGSSSRRSVYDKYSSNLSLSNDSDESPTISIKSDSSGSVNSGGGTITTETTFAELKNLDRRVLKEFLDKREIRSNGSHTLLVSRAWNALKSDLAGMSSEKSSRSTSKERREKKKRY